MMLTRRAAAAMLVAAGLAPRAVIGAQAPWVCAVGNSFLAQHNVTGLFRHLMRAGGRDISLIERTRNGAWLADHVSEGGIFRTLRQHPFQWIILQDHSIAALTPEGRARSRSSVETVLARTGACPVYLTPWPRRAGNPLYASSDMPRTPAEMVDRTVAHYTALAEEFGGVVVPLAEAWQTMTESGFMLYADDDYHANAEGAWFVAMTLTAAFGTDPRYGSPPTLAGLSSLARASVTKPALCPGPTA